MGVFRWVNLYQASPKSKRALENNLHCVNLELTYLNGDEKSQVSKELAGYGGYPKLHRRAIGKLVYF